MIKILNVYDSPDHGVSKNNRREEMKMEVTFHAHASAYAKSFKLKNVPADIVSLDILRRRKRR